MGTQAGGGTRFSKAGSLWKTSWRGRQALDPINFISGFSLNVGGQYYEDAAALDIAAGGWFVGALVGLQELPTTAETIARNGGAANEGWTLAMVPVAGGMRFRFTVYDGAGIAAQVLNSGGVIVLDHVDPLVGNPNRVYMPVLAGFLSAALFPPDGAIFIVTASGVTGDEGEPTVAAAVPLGSAYSNPAPALSIGVGDGGALTAPNVLNGLIGGTAPWTAGYATEVNNAYTAWYASMFDENQIVALSDPDSLGIVTTNGWRAPAPVGTAPDPLDPFVGATQLSYAMGAPGTLQLGHDNPTYFYPQNLRFPFTATPG